MPKLRRIQAKGPDEDPYEMTDEQKLYPERFVRLIDGTTVVIEPWSYVQGRELMNGLLANLVNKYNLFDPERNAFELFSVAEEDLMRLVQLHCEWSDEKMAKQKYEDVMAMAEGIWVVNCVPVLAKSFRLVASLAQLVPRPTSMPGSSRASSTSSPPVTPLPQ